MKNIYLIRHSFANEGIEGQSDFERTLSEKGMEKLVAMKSVYQEIPNKNSVFLCSPSARTKATAEFIANEIGYPVNHIQYINDSYNAELEDLIYMVEDVDLSAENCIFVGHNPSIEQFASYIDSNFSETFKPGDVHRFISDQEYWHKILRDSFKKI